MEGSTIAIGRRRPRKTINEIIKKDLYVKSLFIDVIYGRTLWRRFDPYN